MEVLSLLVHWYLEKDEWAPALLIVLAVQLPLAEGTRAVPGLDRMMEWAPRPGPTYKITLRS